MEANLSIKGAFPPPPGIVPNFTNPDYISGGIIPISAVFLTPSTLFLALRIYTRVHILRIFLADDYVIIASWVLSVASTATCLEQQKNGNGRHLWDIPLDKFVIYEKWAPASELLYVPASALPKVAILIAYLRTFPDNKNFHVAVYTVLFITLGYIISICLAIFFRCQPIAKAWDLALPGHCILTTPYFWNGVLNVITDVMVLAIPIPTLLCSKIPTRRRFVIGGVFATGTLTCILSSVRTYFISRMRYNTDVSRAVVIPTSLSVAESNRAVICGCLMVALPFLRRHLSCLIGSDSGRVERPWPDTFDDEPPLNMLITPLENGPKTSFGIYATNSSAGWTWDQRGRIERHATHGIVLEDVKNGAVGGWPLGCDRLPRSNRLDNIIEERGVLQH